MILPALKIPSVIQYIPYDLNNYIRYLGLLTSFSLTLKPYKEV